ncbi:putative tetratricopeptide-like helical domain superfamily [Helianthus anomalus]
MPQRDTVSWNSLITGYVNHGVLESTWAVIKRMKHCGVCFEEYTFGSILEGVGSNECLLVRKQLHACIVKTGYEQNVYSGSALLDMYAKCGRVVDARKCFDSMPERNTVSWNALISGYVETGGHFNCFSLFKSMHREGVRLDDDTFSPLLTVFDSPDLYKQTTQVHCAIIKHGMLSDCSVLNTTIRAYSGCGSVKDAKKVFDGASGFELDIYTYTSMISSCFEEDITNQRRSLHALVKRGVEHSTPVSNSLMAMYSGSDDVYMDNAIKIFNEIDFKDHVSWNSMLTDLTQHGFSENALKRFQIMQSGNVRMDYYAFSAVLRACADVAALQLGQQIQDSRFGAKIGSFETSYKQNAVTWNSNDVCICATRSRACCFGSSLR